VLMWEAMRAKTQLGGSVDERGRGVDRGRDSDRSGSQR